MTQYTKLPSKVTATRWHRLGDHPLVRLMPGAPMGWLPTKSGGHAVKPGQWIVETEGCEAFTMDDEEFNKIYKEV